MLDEHSENELLASSGSGNATPGTLYALAMEGIQQYIRIYLELTRQTIGFAAIQPEHVQSFEQRLVVLAGINSPLNPSTASPEAVIQEWQHMQAMPFDIELAITKGVYIQLRSRVGQLLDELNKATNGFLRFDPLYISANPRMLPILQRLANFGSKAELKKRIGSVSDNTISAPAAKKLAQILNQRQPGRVISRAQLLQSVEPTLEGIVRDLVGRVLLESIVASALDDADVPYKRESEYSYIQGVVYNFRADFVIPDELTPKAFVEVRKSSSRHASLYAKDKMFSAINWKGKNRELLAVLVVDGPWAAETLRVMTNVFDYVVSLNTCANVANAIAAYIQGDVSKLKWLIDFSIKPATQVP